MFYGENKKILSFLPFLRAETIRAIEDGEGLDGKPVVVLTRHYDGYHFSKNSPDIFNPFSLLNCFTSKQIDNYWHASGTTSYLIDMLRKQNTTLSDIPEETTLAKEGFDVAIESYPLCGIVPMLWQTGYLSIKSHNKYSNHIQVFATTHNIDTPSLTALKNFLTDYLIEE